MTHRACETSSIISVGLRLFGPTGLIAALLVIAALPATPEAAWGGASVIVIQSVAETADPPTPTDNDFTRIDDALQAAIDGDTFELVGTFDWTETNAAASWAAGSDGTPGNGDDYTIYVPATDNLTITATSLGVATIQGPGDLPSVDLEGPFVFSSGGGGTYLNLTISNLTILDFDLALGLFHDTGGSTNAYDGTTVTNNFIRMPVDLMGSFGLGLGEPFQNIGIHYAFGDNQTISNNVIEVPGNGLSDTSDPDSANHQIAASIAMQSNTSGTAYEGLLIDGNEIRVLNAQSADPEIIYGIWENGHAHTKNITVSNNRFLNMDAGNDPSANIQNAFRVTSHSSLASTVEYSGNEVQGANLGMAQLIGFGGQDFSAHEPVLVNGNTFLDNETAILVRSMGSNVMRCNRFFGNTTAVDNEGVLADADAGLNWFGCNAGPGFGACDAIGGTVDVPSWITMALGVGDPTLAAGETTTVTADLQHTSGGGLAPCIVPDGAITDFAALDGSVDPLSAVLTSGSASTTFTAGPEDAIATIGAVIDGELQLANIVVDASETDLGLTKTDGEHSVAVGAALTYEIVVTNFGASNVDGASVEDLLPAELSSCSWTCTASAGASCTAVGADDIVDQVDLDVGASVTYTLSCTATGSVAEILNTATVAVPAGMTDANAANDSATDSTITGIPIFSDGFESGDVLAWTSFTSAP